MCCAFYLFNKTNYLKTGMSNKSFSLFSILVIILALLFIARKIKKNYVPSINISHLVLKDIAGRSINMADFADQPLVINFWGTWCGPCRQEFPDFERVKSRYSNKVNFVMVSDEPMETIIKFKETNNYTFLYAQSQIVFHDLGITAVPVTYFYNAKGKLILKKKDLLAEKELDDLVKELVNK